MKKLDMTFTIGLNVYHAILEKSESSFVAQCLEVDVVSQGETEQSALDNLAEAVTLYIESFGGD